jgi:hypothetical protein
MSDRPSCGVCWLPIGVAKRSWGGAGRLAGRIRGILGTVDSPFVESTGFMLGEGGIPKVSFGVREPLLLREPGTGGLRSGAGDDMMSRGAD